MSECSSVDRRHDGEFVAMDGLDGANPLGFLAALGVFRVASAAAAERGGEAVRLAWRASAAGWTPRLWIPQCHSEGILAVLDSRLETDIREHPVNLLRVLNEVEDHERPVEIRRCLEEKGSTEPDAAAWIAAFASDAAPSDATNQLQTVRRDYYLGNLESILQRTETRHLERTLFRPWDYADALDNQSLHLDPSEDRRHAHQWRKPSGDPNRKKSGGMLGANRLAIEAIPLFTSIPVGKYLRTVGFTGDRSDNTRWTWPIWQCALDLATARSAMVLPELQAETLHGDAKFRLRASGVVAVYRTRRILVGKTPNLTPAVRIA